jgi:hypothetical protein
MSIVLRSSRPLAMALPLRTVVAGLDGKQPLLNVRTMDDVLGRSLGPAQFFARILGVFGLMAVVLAAIGIYGVVSYNVSERTKEFGIRLALGVQRGAVLNDVLRRAAALAIARRGPFDLAHMRTHQAAVRSPCLRSIVIRKRFAVAADRCGGSPAACLEGARNRSDCGLTE